MYFKIPKNKIKSLEWLDDFVFLGKDALGQKALSNVQSLNGMEVIFKVKDINVVPEDVHEYLITTEDASQLMNTAEWDTSNQDFQNNYMDYITNGKYSREGGITENDFNLRRVIETTLKRGKSRSETAKYIWKLRGRRE